MINYEERLEIEAKKTQDKIDDLNCKIRLNPDDYRLITEKGLLLFENEKWDLSIIELQKAIDINPKYFDALYGLGESYCKKADYKKAINAFEKAKLIDSTKKYVGERILNLKIYHKL